MIRFGWVCLLALVVCACGAQEEPAYQPEFSERGSDATKEYVVGIHPLHNPQRLVEVYGPIIEYIDDRMPGIRFRLEASRNYEEFDKKLDAGYFDFAMPNPYQTVRSLRHGYRVFGKMGDDENFRGIILVRKDSGIRTVSDLKGKAVSYPAPTALAATMLPQYFLTLQGLDINHDIENRYVGSQESSILNVLRRDVAAGATWPIPWKAFMAEHPELASQLEVKWQTDSLPNNAWVVRKDIPEPLAERFCSLLFSLHESEEGRRMLARLPVSHFEPANDASYRLVQEFLEKFSQSVRTLSW